MKYKHHESYKHKLAKELLFEWLNNIEKGEDFQPRVPFGWRTGNYGVHMELPFHETDDPYYFELSRGLSDYKEDGSIPLFDPKYNRGNILFVPDLTIFHKGTAVILIEVVHTSPLLQHKLERIIKFFDGFYFEIYQISADNILSQTNLKCDLKFDPIYLPNHQPFQSTPY